MMCGTTPTHVFTLPFDVSIIKEVRIVYAQNKEPVVIKNTPDCTLNGNEVTVKLTQKDTLSFDYRKTVEVQVRVLTQENESLVSAIKAITVGRCLDNGVIG